ncbi:MAG: CRISPR-associated endonuclease Cas3'' [Burkholderiaceae bacterium]
MAPFAPGTLNFPWGKLQRLPEQTSTHSLLDHMTDVAAVLHRLLLIPTIARALQRTAGRPLNDTDHARLAVLAYLHDIGKANTGFQSKYWSDSAQHPPGWPDHRGHGSEGWDLIDTLLSGQHWAQQATAGLPLVLIPTEI